MKPAKKIVRQVLDCTDLIRSTDGRLSLTKLSILMSGIIATIELISQHYTETHPSDELVLGLVTIFVLRHAWAGSKWASPQASEEDKGPKGE